MNSDNSKDISLSPLLEDGRIRLRAVEPIDVRVILEAENDTLMWDYGDTVAPLSASLVNRYAHNYKADPLGSGELRLIIETIDGSKTVGIIDLYDISVRHLHAKVGIYIMRDSRRCRFGASALRLLEAYSGRILGLKSLLAVVDEANDPSIRLFGSAGYVHCGCLCGWRKTSRGFADINLYLKKLSDD